MDDKKKKGNEDESLLPALNELLGTVSFPEAILNRTKDAMWSMVKFGELKTAYQCALKEVRTKFEVLDTEFEAMYNRNPIKTISTRLKSTESIFEKMIRYNFPISVENVEEKLNDVAGIRIVCSYVDDIYRIAEAFLKQDDVTLVCRKDYIANPKPNGYRSLHLIVKVPVFFESGKREMKVEVQIRTIAMDFWASLEHQISYKHEVPHKEELTAQLRECADVITRTDERMLALRKYIEASEDIPTEDEALFERLRKVLG